MKTLVQENAQRSRQLIVCIVAYLITGGMIASLFITPRDFPLDITVIRITISTLGLIGLSRYFGYMVLSPIYDVWHKRFLIRNREAIATYKPLVSVIIPAWNEEVGLISTIRTLLKSTYTNMEIVVINDGSTDRSDELMREFIQAYEARRSFEDLPINIRYRYIPNGGKGNALNHGLLISSGEIIVTIDADCLVSSHAIEYFVRYFTDEKTMAVVGQVKIGNRKSLVGSLQYLEYLVSFYFKKADSLVNAIYIIGGAAGAFRREVFEEIGLYTTTNITEDIDLSMRIQKAGMKVVYAADAVIYTEGASDLPGLIRQRTRWKRGRFDTFIEHRTLFFSRKPEHNKVLSWYVLPMALFGDLQLAFDIPLVGFLTLYGVLSNDFGPFILTIFVVAAIFFTQMLFGEQTKRLNLLLIAPIGWLIFFSTTYIEMRALFNCIWQALFKEQAQWQKWSRLGVLDGNVRHTMTGTFTTLS